MFNKLFQQIIRRKILSAAVLLAVIAAGYFGYQNLTKKGEAVRYVTAAVEKGTLVVSVSGSGQVSSSNQMDIKPKTSGDLVYVGVKNGQEVKAGALLFQLDTKDAKKAVQDAELNLELAQAQLEDLLEPADELAILQAENSLAKAKQSKQKAEDSIVQGYEDAFNEMADMFFDLPTIMTGLNDILYSEEISVGSRVDCSEGWNITCFKNSILPADYDERYEFDGFIDSAVSAYDSAREKYDENFENYRDASRYSEPAVIEALLNETLETLKAMSETVKKESNMLDFWVDYRSQNNLPVFSAITGYQSDIRSYTTKANGYLSALLKIQKSFQDNRQAVLDAEYAIKEKELSLEKLKAGPDDLDVRVKKSAVRQKEDALTSAKENLANCYVYASFDGIIASLNDKVKKGDSVSSGTALATLITKQKTAEITLNEIDIAKLKPGQKATISFDAIDGLTITGEVAEIDALGTISQGVVTYNVKIALDNEDNRVKPGMSISAAVITDVRQNALLIPSSAIKQQGEALYVQVAEAVSANSGTAAANLSGTVISSSNLRAQTVQTGLFNDTSTEILSGLKEGDIVVAQTVNSNSSQRTSQSFGLPGVSSGGQMRTMIR